MKLPKAPTREDLAKFGKGLVAGTAVFAGSFGQGAWYIAKRGYPVTIALLAGGIALGYALGLPHPIGGAGKGFELHAMMQSLGASGIAITTMLSAAAGTGVGLFRLPAALDAFSKVKAGAAILKTVRNTLNPPPEPKTAPKPVPVETADTATPAPATDVPPAADTPAADAPTAETPAAGTPPADTPSPETTAADTPAAEAPKGKTAANDNIPPAPVADAPKGDASQGDAPKGDATKGDDTPPPAPPAQPRRTPPAPGRRM